MSDETQSPYTLLERLDLALASRLARRAAHVDFGRLEDLHEVALGPRPSDEPVYIAGLLGLRGFTIHAGDVERVLSGLPSRYHGGHQEHALILGAERALRMLNERSLRGVWPDGWTLVAAFQELTRDVPRFRNNTLRRDPPWDALLHVSYADVTQVRAALDTFDLEHSFRDFPALYDALHPARRAFRVLWRFARIAPFADFNLVMAWLAMHAFLQAAGYPVPVPGPDDRALLVRLVCSAPPQRVPELERRILSLAEAG